MSALNSKMEIDLNRKTIVFLDDCKVIHKSLSDGFLKNHDAGKNNDVFVFSAAKQLFDLINTQKHQIDYAILDYHLSSMSDGLAIAELIKRKLPDCKIWIYSGMSEQHIHDDKKQHIDRYIHKDYGIRYLLDELSKQPEFLHN